MCRRGRVGAWGHEREETTKQKQQKQLVNIHIVRITSTSVKGRHSIDTEMNAESFEYGYFQ